jgi:hypothetical protein
MAVQNRLVGTRCDGRGEGVDRLGPATAPKEQPGEFMPDTCVAGRMLQNLSIGLLGLIPVSSPLAVDRELKQFGEIDHRSTGGRVAGRRPGEPQTLFSGTLFRFNKSNPTIPISARSSLKDFLAGGA